MTEKDLMLTNRKGKRMPATLRVPDGNIIGTALVLHGLGGWKDQPVIATVAEGLCESGYTTLTFDGSDAPFGPDGKFFDNTNSGYVKDLEDVFAWVQQQDFFVAPVVLVGHSQGGLVALHYASTHQNCCARLVLIAPAVAWYSGMWMMYWPFAVVWLVRGWSLWPGPRTILKLGRRWLLDFLNFDGYKDARTVMVPVLIVSASNDQTVGKPFIHRNLARHFKNATWKMVSGARHSFPEEKHQRELAGIVKEWIAQKP